MERLLRHCIAPLGAILFVHEIRYDEIDPHERRGTNLAAKIAAKCLTTAQIKAKALGRCGLKSLSVKRYRHRDTLHFVGYNQLRSEPVPF